MPSLLQSGGFNLRALPQVPRVDPRDFDVRIGDLLGIFEQAMRQPAALEAVRQTQRRGELERAVQPQVLELARARAANDVLLEPYQAAGERERILEQFTEPSGTTLTEDERGLVQEDVRVRRDPVTGEATNLSTETVKETPQQLRDRRLASGALATKREAEAEAAKSRAEAAKTDAETRRARLEAQIKGLLSRTGVQGRKSFRMFKNERYGRTVGYTLAVFNPEDGSWVVTELDANRRPIGDPTSSKEPPAGQEIDPDTDQPIAAEPAAPATPTPGTIPRVTSDADYAALPPGTEFLDPNGIRRRKP